MNLLVNATSIGTGTLTGIERFGLRITQELYCIDPSTRIISTNDLQGVPKFKKPQLLNLGRQILARDEFLLRAVWDQTVFRYHAMKSKADVVFFPIQDGMFRSPVPQIVTVHDLHYLHFDKEIAECRGEISPLRKALYRLKMPNILSSSIAVIAVSETTKLDLVNLVGISQDKVHVIYNGYDEGRFRSIQALDGVLHRYGLFGRRYFLFVGSILRHKNLDRLVQAFAQLDEEISLVLAGVCKDVSYLHEVKERVRSLGIIPDKVRYLDYVPDQDLPYLYNGALSLVLPSLHEGFGVPIIEAMACGTPVITSNCSAMPEVAGRAALLVDPYSIESIVAAMRYIMNVPELRSNLKEAGFQQVEKFKWSRSAKKLYELCQRVSQT